MEMPKTAKEIVDKCNELARRFYRSMGYQVAEGYRFDKADHPQEKGMWNLASIAFDLLEATDMDEVLMELGED